MERREFLEKLGMGLGLSAIASPLLFTGCATADTRKPNFVIMLGDDCNWDDLGCYGGQAITPNIDNLATQSVRFEQAIGSTAMCTPTRHSLYTGIYPIKRGGYKNHSAVKPGTKSIVHYLRALGYRVGLAGKWHIAPKESFPFEPVGGFPGNCVMQKTPPHDLTGSKEFMTRNAEEPFCLVIASVYPHAPWTEGDRSLYPPDSLKLPPNWLDTPETRSAYQKYLAELTELDRQVGDVMNLLEEEKLADNTLFIFASEQGAQFPGNKWTQWDAGTKFGMLARWPGKIKPNTTTRALVQYEDILPTLIDAAGGKPPANIDGFSFLDVLLGKTDQHRDYAFGLHANVPEGLPYPIRSIRSKQYKLIHNLLYKEPYDGKYATRPSNKLWMSWVEKAKTDEHAAKIVERYIHRPEFEFYDIQNDPYELNNLIDDPKYAGIIREMRSELEAWMKSQGDTGIDTD